MSNPTIEELIEKAENIFIDGMRKAMEVPEDWVYRSSTTTQEAYSQFVELLGEENYRYVSGHVKQSIIAGINRLLWEYAKINSTNAGVV